MKNKNCFEHYFRSMNGTNKIITIKHNLNAEYDYVYLLKKEKYIDIL